MRKVMAILFLALTSTLSSGIKSAQAQESASKAGSEKPIHAYRLDFSLNEFEGEKKTNSRHYSIASGSRGEREEVKIGTRVPVVTSELNANSPAVSTQFQYLDVGTHIWCSLEEHGDELELQAGSDISNIDAGQDRDIGGQPTPVVRQIKLGGSTLVTLGKPIIIGSADDPASKRQFQLEVTVTKLK